MSRLTIVSYQTMESFLMGQGFIIQRQKGSYVFFRHPDGRTTTVPKHKGRDLTRPLIREILREVEISPDEFVRLIS